MGNTSVHITIVVSKSLALLEQELEYGREKTRESAIERGVRYKDYVSE